MSTLNQQGNLFAKSQVLSEIANLYTELGKLEEACKFLEESLSISRDMDERQIQLTNLQNLVSLSQQQINLRTTISYLEQRLRLARTDGDKYTESDILNSLCETHLKIGEFHKAENCCTLACN